MTATQEGSVVEVEAIYVYNRPRHRGQQATKAKGRQDFRLDDL
jgi:hypothetical protein